MFAAAFAAAAAPVRHIGTVRHTGAYALIFGVSLLVLSFRLRARLDKHRQGPTALSGGLRSGGVGRAQTLA